MARRGPGPINRARHALNDADARETAKSNVGLLLAAAVLAEDCKRLNIDHVHAHSCGRSALIAMLSQVIGGPGYSLTLHGPLSDYGPAQAAKWRNSRFAIVITETLKAEVTEQLNGNLPPRLSVAPMGVDTDAFVRAEPYQPWMGEGPLRLFSCGRLNFVKGHDDLVRAVANLRDRDIDADLRIAGADDGSGAYRKSLESLAEELNVAGRIHLLGPQDERIIIRELQSAHIFALASHHEPLGVAIMEAMAMQLPVVVTDAGGVKELVEDDVDGRMVPPKSPDALADAIAELAGDPDRCRRLGAAAAEKIRRSFDSAVSAEQLVNLVQQSIPNPA